MYQKDRALQSLDRMRRAGLDGEDVAWAEGLPLAFDGEVGLAFEAVDGDGSGGGVLGEFAAFTQVEQEDLPALA